MIARCVHRRHAQRRVRVSRGVGSPIASFLARAARRVIVLPYGRRLRVLACVAASALLDRPLGFLLFALALQDRQLTFPRHDGLPAVPALTASANAVGLGPSLVHVERSPVELLPIERIDGGARRAVGHGHEGEAARPPGLPVGDYGDLLDIAVLGERVAKRVFIGVEAQVSYINLHGNISKLVRVTPRLPPVVPLSLGSGLATLAKPSGHGALVSNRSLWPMRGFGRPTGVAHSARTPLIVVSVGLVIGLACGEECRRPGVASSTSVPARASGIAFLWIGVV